MKKGHVMNQDPMRDVNVDRSPSRQPRHAHEAHWSEAVRRQHAVSHALHIWHSRAQRSAADVIAAAEILMSELVAK